MNPMAFGRPVAMLVALGCGEKMRVFTEVLLRIKLETLADTGVVIT